MKKLLLLITTTLILSCYKNEQIITNNTTQTIQEPVPQESITIQIGNQNWIKKNLDVVTYRNGDTIPQVTDPKEWSNLTTGAWCYYNNDPEMGKIYGKLYNWYAVNDSRGLAPEGYRIPSESDYSILIDYLGGDSIAGSKLKESGLSHWQTINNVGTNDFNFSSLPGGIRGESGSFCRIGKQFQTWSCTYHEGNPCIPEGTGGSYCIYGETIMNVDYSKIYSYKLPLFYGVSIRCIKN
jgi:uncharacterized protein (TIGR02145 family)